MHEILKHLSSDLSVLDLGCSTASFAQESTAATAIRLDREIPKGLTIARFVQGDAAKLPFADRTFAAVVSNHSLEHFEELDAALYEIGRVLRADGALFIAVPDASTLTDKVYRWLARGSGHVNPFTSAAELASRIERATGLRHSGTRILYSFLSFLNSRNSPRPRPRRLVLLGGGTEWSLRVYNWLSRRLDRYLNTRTSVYGWIRYGPTSAYDVAAARPYLCLRKSCLSGQYSRLCGCMSAPAAALRIRLQTRPHSRVCIRSAQRKNRINSCRCCQRNCQNWRGVIWSACQPQ